MKVKGIAKIMALMAAAAMLAMGVAGCSNGGQVAATVGDAKIMEDDITNEIQALRTSYGMTDADTWGQYLSYSGYTPETLREAVIDSYVERELVRKAAKENDITVDSATIDSYVQQMKSNYDGDAAWKTALESAGLTEEKYRTAIEDSLLQQQLTEKVCADAKATDDEVLNYVKMYSSTFNGAKKSSHILFDATDEATAKDVLAKLKSGALKFEDAVAQYSKDTGSAADGGNVGWDCLTSFVTEYTDALDGLKKGQMSDLVTSQFGIHIILCTDEFTAPAEITSLDQVPTDLVEYVREMANSYAQQSKYTEWLDSYKEGVNVVVNPMPQGLPYYVDMTKYQTSETDSAATNAATDNTAADNTSNEAASNEAANTNKEGSN